MQTCWSSISASARERPLWTVFNSLPPNVCMCVCVCVCMRVCVCNRDKKTVRDRDRGKRRMATEFGFLSCLWLCAAAVSVSNAFDFVRLAERSGWPWPWRSRFALLPPGGSLCVCCLVSQPASFPQRADVRSTYNCMLPASLALRCLIDLPETAAGASGHSRERGGLIKCLSSRLSAPSFFLPVCS